MLDVKKDPKIAFDYEILECLRECSEESFQDFRGIIERMKAAEAEAKGQFGVVIEEYNYQFYKGVMHFYSQDYAGARNHFVKALALVEKHFEDNEGLTHDD